MAPRERLLSVLSGHPVDPAPIWLLFPYHATSYYVDVRTHPAYRPVFERACREAVTLNRRNLGVPMWTPDVQVSTETFSEGDDTVHRTTLRCGAKALVGESRRSPSGTRQKRLLSSEDDLDTLLTFPVETNPERVHAHLNRALPRYLDERSEFPPDLGAMMLDLGEPIGWLYHNAATEELSLWSLTCPGKVKTFLDRAMAQKRIVYDACLERNLADVYFLVGSELAAPPLVGLGTFRSWILPYARELIERIHAHGRFAIQHFHGHIRAVLPEFLLMKPDALHTIEAPPVGNCTLTEAFEVVGDRIALIGNIQYDDFRSLTPDGMRAAVRAVLAEARGRRFILSPTAGPYEADVSARVIENYMAFLDATKANVQHRTLNIEP